MKKEDKDLKEWQYKNRGTDLSQLFIEARQNFILRELQNIFTWKNWYYELKDLNEFLLENRTKFSAESVLWITGLMEKQKELYDISEKFKQMVTRLSKENSFVEKNDILQKRIKDGAIYFYNEISRWEERFFNHPLSVETKKIARKTDRLLEEISYILQEILHNINHCKNGFLLDDYLTNRKSFIVSVKNIKSSYKKNKVIKPNTVEETIRYFREGKSIGQIAKERNLVISTIEGHLARAIKQNLIQIDEVMQIEEVRKIAEFFPQNLDEVQLSTIKEKAPAEITYGKLRMVLAWLQKKK